MDLLRMTHVSNTDGTSLYKNLPLSKNECDRSWCARGTTEDEVCVYTQGPRGLTVAANTETIPLDNIYHMVK